MGYDFQSKIVVTSIFKALASNESIKAKGWVGYSTFEMTIHNEFYFMNQSSFSKRDRDVIATGIFDASHHDSSQRMRTTNSRATKAVLCTGFSLNEKSHSEATSFTKLL
mmetsp:Transcript_9766/g.15032  ORF Transcript_9766/g.15032 Transcript_9766/m.15032 type:complete len:109 (+) Transcript_9766:196-522(+)